MGEYARLNKMLEEYKKSLKLAEAEDADVEEIADLQQSIGEIKGALLEMAEVDGLDDPYEAFDYCEESKQKEYAHPVHGKIVDIRFEAYHDVTVYEDGHEERFYIGD